MIWRRVALFVLWALFCLIGFFFALFITQMGDCFDVTACNEFKDRAMRYILIGAPVIWLGGSLLMVYRWSRDV